MPSFKNVIFGPFSEAHEQKKAMKKRYGTLEDAKKERYLRAVLRQNPPGSTPPERKRKK